MKITIYTVIISFFFLFGCKKESHETKASDTADRYVGNYAAEVYGGGPGVITITKSGIEIIVSFKEDTEDFYSYDKQSNSAYQKKLRNGSKGIYNHISTNHSTTAIERLKLIPKGKIIFNANGSISYPIKLLSTLTTLPAASLTFTL